MMAVARFYIRNYAMGFFIHDSPNYDQEGQVVFQDEEIFSVFTGRFEYDYNDDGTMSVRNVYGTASSYKFYYGRLAEEITELNKSIHEIIRLGTTNPDDLAHYVFSDADRIYGSGADDFFDAKAGNDRIWSRSGNDEVYGNWGNDQLYGQNGRDILYGGTGDDRAYGGSDADRLHGGRGADLLIGEDGNDTLHGDSGNDRLIGKHGKDVLTGGTRRDEFIFERASDSWAGRANRDIITDFEDGDKIKLTDIDANTRVGGNQNFRWIGDDRFSGRASQLRYDDGVIQGDLNGDRRADLEIAIENDAYLSRSDFWL